MSEDEAFLQRWARRKRDAASEAAEGSQSPPEPSPPPADAAPPAEASAAPAPLPPIELIGADSDISAFLAADVPGDLSQAALRRAWSTDPAIRDFIGLSENSWDFTAIDGVPGFGAITPNDIARLLKRVMGETEEGETAEAAAAAPPTAAAPSGETPAHAARTDEAEATLDTAEELAPYKVNAAVQNDFGEGERRPSPAPRRHGGALPD